MTPLQTCAHQYRREAPPSALACARSAAAGSDRHSVVPSSRSCPADFHSRRTTCRRRWPWTRASLQRASRLQGPLSPSFALMPVFHLLSRWSPPFSRHCHLQPPPWSLFSLSWSEARARFGNVTQTGSWPCSKSPRDVYWPGPKSTPQDPIH